MDVKKFFDFIDWPLFLSTLPLLGAGLVTMNSFSIESDFFTKQIIWIIISITTFLIVSQFDYRFLRNTWPSVFLFLSSVTLLSLLFGLATVTKGTLSWFDFGFFSFQPADLIKLFLIIILAKYFSRRHIEIAYIRHILISGIYAFVLFILVLIQPDFGAAIIIFLLWLGMVLVSGISKKHIAIVGISGLVVFACLWNFGFQDYQKNRIRTFLNPLADIHGTGYNANQSMIAIGSGEVFGKGVGFGTQSRLKFLPEYQTDFVFAAFAEEWGFVGVLFVFLFFGLLVYRIIKNALLGSTNFEILFGLGLSVYFIIHFSVNVGMNLGVLPVTGTALPFLSYGGTHLLTEFIALGMLMAMRKYSRVAHKDSMKNEFIGPR